MSKDFKEKYERVCSIKDKAISLVETQLNGNIENVDAEELGEVADIAKDMAELMKLCAEAEYYHKVTEAMDEGSEEEKKYYMNKYIPEYDGKFYTPIEYARQRDSRGRYMYTEPRYYDGKMMNDDLDKAYSRMYYTNPGTSGSRGNTTSGSGSMGYARDYREGRSGMTRRMYMDMKDSSDKNSKIEEIKKYSNELIDDLNEMLEDASPEEKATLKQKLTTFVGKL